jgi:hypothetical protein
VCALILVKVVSIDLKMTVVQMLYKHKDTHKSKFVSSCSITVTSVCIYHVSYVFY